MFNNFLGHLGIILMAWVVADILLRLMSPLTTKKPLCRDQPWCPSLDDIMPSKMSSNPLQKFRSYAGTKVNWEFDEQTVGPYVL